MGKRVLKGECLQHISRSFFGSFNETGGSTLLLAATRHR